MSSSHAPRSGGDRLGAGSLAAPVIRSRSAIIVSLLLISHLGQHAFLRFLAQQFMVAEQRGQVLSFTPFLSALLFHTCQASVLLHHHLQTLLRNDNHSVFLDDASVTGMDR